jgi:hypothetical protein
LDPGQQDQSATRFHDRRIRWFSVWEGAGCAPEALDRHHRLNLIPVFPSEQSLLEARSLAAWMLLVVYTVDQDQGRQVLRTVLPGLDLDAAGASAPRQKPDK